MTTLEQKAIALTMLMMRGEAVNLTQQARTRIAEDNTWWDGESELIIDKVMSGHDLCLYSTETSDTIYGVDFDDVITNS
jgi:hypothetical protein